MKIALFGGAFDPPHMGHVRLAQHLLKQETFDEVWVIPVHTHPFAKNMSTFADRINMCQLAFSDPKIKIQDFEKNLSGYTIDLIQFCLKQFPKNEFHFCCGSDLKDQVTLWKDAEELQKIIPFHFYERGKDFFGEESSSVIRQQLSKKNKLTLEIPLEVKKYIDQKNLYAQG